MRWKRIKKSLKLKKPDDYEVKKERLRALESLSLQNEIDLYYADGSGFGLIPNVPYAWQSKNERLEVPSFRGKTLNIFGLWNAKNDLRLYEQEKCFNSQNIIDCIDNFCDTIDKKTTIVLDNASVHKSKIFKEKVEEWLKKGLDIFYLPTYSPQLNKIEHLWRFIKYEWIEFDAYKNFENLKKYVQKIKQNFGKLYTINFA